MGACAVVSFRLGSSDGVSVVAALWQRCLHQLGWTTTTVAGAGPVDELVPGLEIGAAEPPDRAHLEAVLERADLVVAENILTIPLNLPASRVLSQVLRGRPALLHHHDPPWQRQRFAHITELPPDDRAWRHVTINRLTERQFAERGLTATTIPNGFDTTTPPGDRASTRARLGLGPGTPLVAHPVRAIARKNIPVAMDITARQGGVYWLPGPPEEDYAPALEALLADPPCPVIRTPLDTPTPDRTPPITVADLYAAADLIVFPSTWEGFGNPPIEAAIHRRPVVVGPYPVAAELRALGFWWLDPDDHQAIAEALAHPPTDRIEANRALVERHLSLPATIERVKRVLVEAGWVD